MIMETLGFLNMTMVDFLDITIVAAIIYAAIRWIKGSSAVNIFIAIIILLICRILSVSIGMKMLSSLLGTLLDVGAIALIVIFQPEIRRFLNRIGSSAGKTIGSRSFLHWLLPSRSLVSIDDSMVDEIARACMEMGEQKTGALIILRKRNTLEDIVNSIVRSWKTDDPLPEMLREELQDKLKLYMLVGGMPEAVTDWVETGDIREVDKTLDGILRAYPLDFSKYATAAEVIRINRVWNSMQRQLARDNKRFKYSDVQKGARAREYETSVDWLCKAGLVHKVCNTETVRLPLMAYKDENAFKLYLNDVGLLRRMFNLESTSVMQESRLFMEFKGVLTENYVLMSILCQGYEPLYWTSGNQAEVEFVIEDTGRIIPIEVKSKESIQSKSLSEYRKKFNPELAIRCSQKNLQIRDGLLNLPLPLADRMKDYVKTTPGDIIETGIVTTCHDSP